MSKKDTVWIHTVPLTGNIGTVFQDGWVCLFGCEEVNDENQDAKAPVIRNTYRSSLMDKEVFSSLPVFQQKAFQCMDVLLTGGVLAGGSDSMITRTKQNRLRNRILVFSITVSIFFQHAAIASDEIEKSGDVFQVLIPAVAYGATLHLNDSEGQTQFYKSFFTSLFVTYGLKNLIDKKRPNGSDKSFPSGHTSAAFQGASFIHKRYGIKYAIPAYIGAAFVGYSRVESNNHYIEDVIAGAAIGVLSSFCFTKPYKGIIITPTVDNGAYGLNITKKW